MMAARNPEQNNSKPSKKHILVMDDDVMLQGVVGLMLERLGYGVDYAFDGREAIDKYKSALQTETPFVAVIMDLIVPLGMGGREAMQMLLELDPQIKVIVSSGYVHNSVLEDYQHYGFKDVLIKPYRFPILKRCLMVFFEMGTPSDMLN
jgi:two-component system, cell cycle sensor histidine kinase and response regulator CckA